MNAAVIRVAAVSFLNARPLLWGLDTDPSIQLKLAVPSRLIDLLRDDQADVALLPTIDYQRLPGLRVVPAGGIGCNGPTLTVRIFARQPIHSIRSLCCDTDSHTSVALARVILAERYGIKPEFAGLASSTGRDDEAILLIGDKVVRDEPAGYPHQYDLGDEWKKLTGMPFVFAVWTARPDVELGELPQRLERARREGLSNVQQIVDREAVVHGWPPPLALQYLTEYLKFDIGTAQLTAIDRFHQLAATHGAISVARSLDVVRSS